MKRLLLVFIIMATWIVVGCETVRQASCYGHWVTGPGPQRGTRALIKMLKYHITNVLMRITKVVI